MAQLQTERESRDPAAEAVGTLEEENRLLQERLMQLTEEVSRNDSLLRKTQERELELLRAGLADAAVRAADPGTEGPRTSSTA